MENTLAGNSLISDLFTYPEWDYYWFRLAGESYSGFGAYVYEGKVGFSVYGCAYYLSGSEGMCGSFDNGDLRYRDGNVIAPFDYGGLGESWQVSNSENLLVPASDVCIPPPDNTCGNEGTCTITGG